MSKKSVSPNKSNQIYRTVRDDIIHGIYPGGTFITEAVYRQPHPDPGGAHPSGPGSLCGAHPQQGGHCPLRHHQ